MAEYEINEDTTAFLELRFKNERGQDVVPISGIYRIDDLTSLSQTITGTEILGDTVFVPTINKFIIVIDSALNQILCADNVWEDRQVTVEWTYFSGTSGLSVGTDVFLYQVKNLNRISGLKLGPW